MEKQQMLWGLLFLPFQSTNITTASYTVSNASTQNWNLHMMLLLSHYHIIYFTYFKMLFYMYVYIFVIKNPK